ncbi:MAG TPA: TetR family transcriptional regulator [Acidimicrobiales bacterium]|nr:TetR family transcriptional regulator [Acidimicrobiales bacterium]
MAATLELLRETDHSRIQMRDVADAAGVALGTVYRYFRSKEHLLAEVLSAWAQGLRADIDRRPLQGDSNVERLTDALHRSVRAFESWPAMARVLIALEGSTDPFTQEVFARNNRQNAGVYVEVLRDLPPDVAGDVVRVASAVLDLQLRQWAIGNRPIADVYERLARSVWLLLRFHESGPDPG